MVRSVGITDVTQLLLITIPQSIFSPDQRFISFVSMVVVVVPDRCDWVSAALVCGANPSLLQRLFGVLHRAMFHDDTDTRGAAALALKHVCDATAGHLAPFLEPLMQLLTTALASSSVISERGAVGISLAWGVGGRAEVGVAGSAGSAGRGMDAEDVLQIIEGLGYVVSALPSEQAGPVLTTMLCPIATPLLHMFPEEAVAGPPDANVIVLYFDRLAAVLRYVAHPELVATSFRELWPAVARGLERCGDKDERAAEHICRCIKYALRTAR
jgi:hypothetical protein